MRSVNTTNGRRHSEPVHVLHKQKEIGEKLQSRLDEMDPSSSSISGSSSTSTNPSKQRFTSTISMNITSSSKMADNAVVNDISELFVSYFYLTT